MAKSCEDVSAQMMELLYGELSEGERASLEGHITGCARCRAEREGFETTRAMARGALDEPVPARAHAAILRAAADHLAANPRRELAASRGARPRTSFWDWFRTRWTLPTLATVGAVAVVLIGGKVFLDPKRTYERGREALAPAPGPAPAPAAAPAPGAPPMAEPSAAAPMAKRESGDSTLDGLEGVGGGRKSFEKAGKSKGAHHAKAGGGSASPPADNKKAPGSSLEDLLGAATRRDRAKDEVGSVNGLGGLSSGGAASGAGSAAPTERRQFAAPPPSREAAKPAAKRKAPARETGDTFAQPPPSKPGKREIADDLLLDGDFQGVGGKSSSSGPQSERERKADKAQEPLAKSVPAPRAEAPTAAPPPSPAPRATSAPVAAGAPTADAEASRSSSKKSRPPAETRTPAKAESAESPMASEEAEAKPSAGPARGKSGSGGSTDALAQRADRLFADGRWTEAAAAYRDLLRLDPRNAAAARWRSRLSSAQAQAQIAARRAAPAAKASKGDVTDKPSDKASLDSAPAESK